MNLLQTWLQTDFFHNSLAAYATSLLTMMGLIVVFILIKRLFLSRLAKWAARTPGDFDDFVVSVLSKIGGIVFVVTSLYIATIPLVLDPRLRGFLHAILLLVITMRLVLILQDIVKYAVLKSYRRARPSDAAAETAATNITNILRWALWALALVFMLDNMGVNISALLAGLGIGGVAVAFASQAVLADLFSAVAIFVDKPFELGDFIIIEGFMGSVEYIGLKTTRIRSLSGERIIFANSDLTKSRIRNYKWLQIQRVSMKFQVGYQTPAPALEKIPVLVKNIVEKLKDARFEYAEVASFGDFGIFYEVAFSVPPSVVMQRQTQLAVGVKDAFDREGIGWLSPPSIPLPKQK